MTQGMKGNLRGFELLRDGPCPAHEYADIVPAIAHRHRQIADVDGSAADRIGTRNHVRNLHRASFRERITRKASLRKIATAAKAAGGNRKAAASQPRPGRSRSRKRM